MNRSQRETRLVQRIRVQNANGETHTVEEWGDFQRYEKLEGGWTSWARTGGRLKMGNKHVNATKDKAVFELVETGERLTVISP